MRMDNTTTLIVALMILALLYFFLQGSGGQMPNWGWGGPQAETPGGPYAYAEGPYPEGPYEEGPYAETTYLEGPYAEDPVVVRQPYSEEPEVGVPARTVLVGPYVVRRRVRVPRRYVTRIVPALPPVEDVPVRYRRPVQHVSRSTVEVKEPDQSPWLWSDPNRECPMHRKKHGKEVVCVDEVKLRETRVPRV